MCTLVLLSVWARFNSYFDKNTRYFANRNFWLDQEYLQNLGTTKRSNMKKNTFKVWKQTFSELDFWTLRLESAGLGISLNARQHSSSGRNKPCSLIEDFKTRCLTTFFFLYISTIPLVLTRRAASFATCLQCATEPAPAPSFLRNIAWK